jgi:glycosyltransferase involved in cell wall biosynthesis
MPNILHLIDTTGPGGAETLFVGLASHFSRPPYRSTAMIRGPGWVKDQLDERGIPVIVENSRGSVNLSYLRRLIRHLKEQRADLLHAHLPGANLYGSMAGRLHGIPVISTFHGSVDLGSKGRMDSIKHRIVSRYSCPVAVSEPLRQEVSDALALAAEAVRLIPNGIDCKRFAAATPLGLRKQFGLSSDTFVIGSLGNIRPAKDYATGLRALHRLRAEGLEAHWFIAGQYRPGDNLMAELQVESKALDVADYAHFLGFVAEPERFLAEIDAFLLCSSSEGHPLALTQAMAAGRPIVATRCGVEQVLDENEHAWLAPVGGDEELARHLEIIAGKPDEVGSRAARAQHFAKVNYDFAEVLRRYEGLYRELLGRAAG